MIALVATSCGGDDPLPPDDRPGGATCQASVQCASKVCVDGGTCPDGSSYRAFCAGEPCTTGDCPIFDKCITLQHGDRTLRVCVPTGICP